MIFIRSPAWRTPILFSLFRYTVEIVIYAVIKNSEHKFYIKMQKTIAKKQDFIVKYVYQNLQ